MSSYRAVRPLPRLRAPMQQTCKMCGQPDKFDFYVPDELWREVVPKDYQALAVCLYCFDEEAAAKSIDFAADLTELCFAGRSVCLGFKIASTGSGVTD